MHGPLPPIESAEIVLPCRELEPTLAFFTERLGLRVDAIFPADDPAVAVVSGHGLRLRLERSSSAAQVPVRLRLATRALEPESAAPRATLVAPNGALVEFVPARTPIADPPLVPACVVTTLHADAPTRWKTGRAGMRYRDLIPGRLGGRFIASHIAIPSGGPVPDYVHFHRVRFQAICVLAGWVRVVYEDQGPAFVMQAGDCVLQPPEIRHRVLESSDGLEVLEIGAPAEHETRADHELELPTGELRPERDFSGQRFVRHVARDAAWSPPDSTGYAERDTGIAQATRGLASIVAVRRASAGLRTEPPAATTSRHTAELLFRFVTRGHVHFACEQADEVLGPGAACTIPAGRAFTWDEPTPDLEFLEVALPADFRVEDG